MAEWIPTSTTPSASPTPAPLKETLKKTSETISEEFATLITNAFALMAALAWSEFVKTLFSAKGPLSKMPVGGPFLYAVLATCIALVVTATIGRFKKNDCLNLCPTTAKP